MANYDPATCTKDLTQGGFVPICPDIHCNQFQETDVYHANCNNAAMYNPVSSPACYNPTLPPGQQWYIGPIGDTLKACMKLAAGDANWTLIYCYCCCSCFANQTAIDVIDSDGKPVTRPIGDIELGQQVLSGRVVGGKVAWQPAAVEFSMGTGGGTQPAMVFIYYGGEQKLIASPDQVFMLADGKLTTAAQLVPGESLMDRDGNPVPVNTVSVGGYQGGVHHIATSMEWTGSPDDHLILAGGVVAGDYVLQLSFEDVPADRKAPDQHQRPTVGTVAYHARYTHLAKVEGAHVFAAAPEHLEVGAANFRPYSSAQTTIPYGAEAFLGQAQADDITNSGQVRPVTDRAGYASVAKLLPLFQGLYPQLTFYFDWSMPDPNVYAFQQYGKNLVVIAGGLARVDGFQLEGLAMAIANAVSRFIGGDPKDGSYSCLGKADLYAFGVVSQQLWFGNTWLAQTMKAYQQTQVLFGLIQPANAAGNPNDVCNQPSIECRLTAINNGIAGGPLPECAGGPAPPMVQLELATPIKGGATLVFSQALDPAQAKLAANYTLDPPAKVSAAALDADQPWAVTLTAELTAATRYRVTAANLVSIYGMQLDPAASSTSFTTDAAPAPPGPLAGPRPGQRP